MEQTQKFYKFILPHSLPTPPKLNVGFERLVFQNLPDFNIEIEGRGVEIVKNVISVVFQYILSGIAVLVQYLQNLIEFFRNCFLTNYLLFIN